MTCEACTEAQHNPTTGHYRADCDGCKARALANGQEAWEARKAGRMTQRYKTALRTLFGDRWEEGHAQVKRWSQKGTA